MQVKQIQALMEKMKETGLSRLEVCEDNFSLKLERQENTPVATAPSQASLPPQEAAVPKQPADDPGGHVVASPVVGIYYESPSPDESPFVSVGQTVEPGMTLCIIEAMKLMNEVTCDRSGIVTEIMVENGQRVEYGQPLIRIGGGDSC